MDTVDASSGAQGPYDHRPEPKRSQAKGKWARRTLHAVVFAIFLAKTTNIYGEDHRIESWGFPDLRHQSDKQQHFLIGFAAAAFTDTFMLPDNTPWYKRAAVDIGTAAVLGIAKEISDYQHPRTHDCDPKDAIATTLGGAALFSVSYIWRF